MGRQPQIDKNGMKKGAWSQEEDDKLRAYIMRYGHWNWRQLPKFAGLFRCGKSCRLRWMNYLRQNLKWGNYTQEEEDLILKLRDKLGNKWSAIAAKLPGRTDNEIKNYWHSHLKKCVKQNSNTSEVMVDQSSETSLSKPNPKDKSIETCQYEVNQEGDLAQENVVADVLSQHTTEGYTLFPESTSSGLSSLRIDYAILSGNNATEEDSVISFESYPLSNSKEQPMESVADIHPLHTSSLNFDYALLSGINCFEEDIITSMESYFESNGNFWANPFSPGEIDKQGDFLVPAVEGGFMSPFVSYYDDGFEFFDQILMEEVPRN